MKVLRVAAVLLAAAASSAPIGCANWRLRPPASPSGAGSAPFAGWALLAEGRRDEAEHAFSARLADAPAADPIALFGRATVAYERGASLAAADDYVSVLRALAAAPPSVFASRVASVAAGRLLSLSDELGAAARARLVGRLRPVELARASALPWLSRVLLARLADRVARQAGDADALARDAAEDGCANRVFAAGSAGPFAYLDLDLPLPPSAVIPEVAGERLPGEWRPVVASGCQLDLPAAADGRGGARILRAAIDASAGRYDLVLDFAGEARLSVDGGSFAAYGSATGYGPRLGAGRVVLGAGRHQLTIRLAAKAGEARLGLWVLPVDDGAGATFVDPREGPAAPRPSTAPVVAALPAEAAPRDVPGAAALADYCAAFVADVRASANELAAAADRLRSRPRFAIGFALLGETARHDSTRPATFARDAARRSLRQAVAIDPALARAWQRLALVELDDDRPRDAIDDAQRARAAAPGWWAPDLTLAQALGARGLGFDADRALSEAADETRGGAPCAVLEALRTRAQERRDLAREEELESALTACGGDVDARVDRLRERGENDTAIAVLRTALRLDPGREDLSRDLALLLAAEGRQHEALGELESLVSRDPQDPLRRVRLADAQAAAGQMAAARKTIEDGLLARPDVPEVRRAARALGVSLPLDAFRVDGRAAIRAFEVAAGHYTGPGVIVLDRGVTRVFPSGATMVLTHEIVRVDSKDAIDKWGEIDVPEGAEILTVRTHKPDGSTREPEDIAGKDTISAPDLAIGDYVEWELLETHSPSDAFAPGFLGERFYFQSFDAPIARSELTLVAPAGLEVEIDRRAGAPAPETRLAADGTRITRFVASSVPQLYAERSAVPADEYVPSVRASSGVGWDKWAAYVADELHDAVRASPDVQALGRRLAAAAPHDRASLAAAVIDWVTANVEATDDLVDPAGYTLARGRGSRTALALALLREVGVPARAVLARSRLVAEAADPAPPEQLEDFGDTLIEMNLGRARTAYADLRLRHAAFGYVPPGLDGARTVSLPGGTFGVAHSTAAEDRRTIDMTIRLDDRGGGVAVATEELAGWPALEWAELVDRFGGDRVLLRQDFEQRSLGVQFPGARLRDLEVELPRDASGRVGTARVRYSFVSAHLAVPIDRGSPDGQEMRLEPTFFRSQPGRRFATEPQRSTGLMLGFDVPVRMTATVELPGAARLDDAGLSKDLVVSRQGGYRFLENREIEPGRPNVLVLHRESALPIMRISPRDYAAVAADLRRVDGAEQAEIRIRLGGAGRSAGAR